MVGMEVWYTSFLTNPERNSSESSRLTLLTNLWTMFGMQRDLKQIKQK